MLRLVLSANEPSGDLLAAELLAALRAGGPVEAVGLCGPAMRAAGVRPLAHLEDTVAMGVAEVLARLPALRRARAALRTAVEGPVDAFIGVDAPDLHLPIAAAARRAGRLAAQVVAPQVWAWRPGRAPQIAAQVDLLLCLFDFEPALFNGHGPTDPGAGPARWIGHPAVDRLAGAQRQRDPALLALCPGSRPQELRRHLRPFLEAGARWASAQPGRRLQLLLPAGAQVGPVPPEVERVSAVQGLASAGRALTKSGTITLELGLLGVPMLVAHRVHPLTWALGRLLVRGVRHIALPNILAGAERVPEHIQRWSPAGLATALDQLPAAQPLELRALGGPGAAARAAAALRAALADRG
ncbi:MAG: lipid-A-disaccharide synthase [Deltaproteobacteria bacterium]|nr:lipid-A-disaccharide synthase [Deltaproteobacteria bacterium]